MYPNYHNEEIPNKKTIKVNRSRKLQQRCHCANWVLHFSNYIEMFGKE
jgi:hypothetical protein